MPRRKRCISRISTTCHPAVKKANTITPAVISYRLHFLYNTVHIASVTYRRDRYLFIIAELQMDINHLYERKNRVFGTVSRWHDCDRTFTIRALLTLYSLPRTDAWKEKRDQFPGPVSGERKSEGDTELQKDDRYGLQSAEQPLCRFRSYQLPEAFEREGGRCIGK